MADPKFWQTEHVSTRGLPLVSPFAGYPYLVTRIGRTALRHIILLDSNQSEVELMELAWHQQEENWLPAALCLRSRRAIYFDDIGSVIETDLVPTGIAVADQLLPRDEAPTDEYTRLRVPRLRAYVEEHRPSGYLVGDGLEAGRPASAIDRLRLTWDGYGVAPGLLRCDACGELAGEFLQTNKVGGPGLPPGVIDVRCRCDNPNRCARCGGPLFERALSAWYWNEAVDEPDAWYVAAYLGLSHRCG